MKQHTQRNAHSTPKTATCWVYCAVSSGRQEATLEDQLAWGRRCALENGWAVTREFGGDREGVGSGKAGVRKILDRLLNELRNTPKAHRPGRVLMIRLDRIGRGDVLETAGAFAEIRKLGVIVHTRDDGDNTVRNALDSIKPFLKLLTGALENDARRDKSIAAHRKRREKGLSWRAPYGMRCTAEYKLEPKEPEASIIRELFALRVEGLGYSAIGRRMRMRDPNRSWARSSVLDALHRTTYRGTLIDEATFDAVGRMEGVAFVTRAKQRWPWPLAKALRCAECGHILHGECSGKERWRKRYYFCDNSRHDCRRLFVAEDLETQFEELLSKIAFTDEVLASYSRRQDGLEGLQQRVRQLEAELRQNETWRQEAWEKEGQIDGRDLAERLKHLSSRRNDIENALEALRVDYAASRAVKESSERLKAVLGQMSETWRASSVEMQQRIAQAVSAAIGGLWVGDANPDRIRGSSAKRNSARGVLLFQESKPPTPEKNNGCVQGFEKSWTELATHISILEKLVGPSSD